MLGNWVAGRAQTAHFNEAVKKLGGGFSAASSVAVDGNGNVYICSTSNGQVLMLRAPGYPSITVTWGSYLVAQFQVKFSLTAAILSA
ncbi:MAG: SBBP repeat-containing protein [Terracidiphilus sp.]